MNRFLKACFLSVIFLLISFCVNWHSNIFSPILSPYGCVDPAYFYMTGKAWAHGMLPYVDFTDVKGPIVFLLFRIGYMLTPDSLDGIFGVYVVMGALTVGLTYRMARIFDLAAGAALMVSVCVFGAAYWSNISYSSAQPELLALPALIWMMGNFCGLIRQGKIGEVYLSPLAWSLGLGGAYVLLLKYNMCLPFFAAFMLTLVWMFGNSCFNRCFWPFFWRCCVGAATVILPIIITFTLLGNLYAFADAYFLSNFRSYFGHQEAAFYSRGNPLSLLVKNNLNRGCCLPTALSLLYLFLQFIRQKGQQRMVYAGLLVFGLSIYATAAMTVHPYYFIYCAPLTIFPLMAVCTSSGILRDKRCGGIAVAGVLLTVCVLSSHHNYTSTRQADRIEKRLASVPNARILYWRALEQGFGYRSGALPACRVWATLNGMEESFYDDTRQCIRDGKADFIFTQADLPQEETAFLTDAHYTKVTDCKVSVFGVGNNKADFIMWAK